MTARHAAIALGAATAAFAAWTALASLVFLSGTLLIVHHPKAYGAPALFWQFWAYLPYADRNRTVAVWLHRSEIAASCAILLAFGAVLYRVGTASPLRSPIRWLRKPSVERGRTDNHGHAAWLSIDELRRMFPGPDPGHGGVVIGEAYRVDQDSVAKVAFDSRDPKTWGQGGKAPLLIDPCRDGPAHALVFAGSGGFKSRTAVSSLLHWRGSCVVLDPSCELGPMLRRAREEMGHSVVMLSLETAARAGLNVLDWIDIRDPLAEAHVKNVVSWICGDVRRDTADSSGFFAAWGRDLVTCFLANMLWDEGIPARHKTLRAVRHVLAQPEKKLRQHLATIYRTSRSGLARDIAGSLLEGEAKETFSSVVFNANEQTSWLSVRAYADLVSGNTFRTSDLVGGGLSVFVQIPIDALRVSPEVARTMVGALLNAVYRDNGNSGRKVLFLLDEAARLGKLGALEEARDVARKYGAVLLLYYQSLGHLEEIWGRGSIKNWLNSASWYSFAAVRDYATAQEISNLCGTFGAMAYSDGSQRGRSRGSRSSGENTNRHEINRRLILPAEVLQDMRDDEQVLFARGRPARIGRAIYHRRSEMLVRIDANRFAREPERV